MRRVLFNECEIDALRGLTWIPQLIYFRAIRPNMDYDSGTVGLPDVKGKAITYELVRDEVQPSRYKGVRAQRDLGERTIVNAFNQLIKAGLLEFMPIDDQPEDCFSFLCLLADTNDKGGAV